MAEKRASIKKNEDGSDIPSVTGVKFRS